MNKNSRIISRTVIADHITPVTAYAALGAGPYSFLLESVEKGKNGRYSFIGFSPRRVYLLYRGCVRVLKEENGEYVLYEIIKTGDPVGFIGSIQERYMMEKPPGLPPFCGGLVGHTSYEIIQTWENICFPDSEETDPLLGVFMFIDETVAFDHLFNTALIIKIDVDRDGENARRRVEEIKLSLMAVPSLDGIEIGGTVKKSAGFISNFSKERFEESVRHIKKQIVSGEIIQGVLSQRLESPAVREPFNCYRALRVINPSPYMFYLKMGEVILCGSSPETLVKVEGERASVRPIAGTRPRALTDEEDLEMSADLLSDDKERAEHVMLVDLGRNDLSKVCRPGSVAVDGFMSVEKYSHVMHMVTGVSGRLKEGTGCAEVFKACFPAGTVSGAPKIRAIEIIRDCEKSFRGPYAGAAGYFSFTGGMDMCISIRTMVMQGGKLFVQAGAGIVKDSVPEKEYAETMNKARALLEAVRIAANS